MTEVERARDKAMVALCYAAVATAPENHKAALTEAAFDLDMASKKQHDQDRNGVVRKMGKPDCVEVTEGVVNKGGVNKSPTIPPPPPPKGQGGA